MKTYTEAALSSAKEAALITVIDLVPMVVGFFALGYSFTDSMGFILLVEGAVLMLAGGAVSFAGQPGVRRLSAVFDRRFGRRPVTASRSSLDEYENADVKAAFFSLTGVLLFVESIVLAVLVTSI